ncbi:MAG: 2-hydroxyacyl-CoA dehydratase family protein [Synergistaceae bacterium]|jgi:benzoyl-CoA reductase/2-hydroxyglutaryl-CoA dehydratase subunit BcrC/BadD/HgdB|nr:2-hydroxyacyl-CoA dehydratase family protein [Synergistaceae bacterium]
MHDINAMLDRMRDESAKAAVVVKEAKERGRRVVGAYCVFTPTEVIRAAGAWMVSLCSKKADPIAAAEERLPRNLCPLIKASYGYAYTDTCPYFALSDAVVGETTCDGKKKMYEYLGEIKPVYVMQLPQVLSERAEAQWRDEIVSLEEWLESTLGTRITDDGLRRAIVEANGERRALNDFFALSQLDPPPVNGLEIMMVAEWTRLTYDPVEAARRVNELTRALRENYEAGERRIAPGKRRILVTGCPLGKAVEKTITAIENNGGVVVCYDNCGHYKGTVDLVDETKPPVDAIAEKYIRTACSVISPNDRRMDLLLRFADEFKVDGVVDIILQACHTYAIETTRVRETLKEKRSIPCISIETDYYQGDTEQLSTRMGAFMEMMA